MLSMLTNPDLVKDWYSRMLPFPLLKYEQLKTKERIEKEFQGQIEQDDMADEEVRKKIRDFQPKWRDAWLVKHTEYFVHLVGAPKAIRKDLTMCPLPRMRTWEEHSVALKKNPTWLNYPRMPAPSDFQELDEKYMVITLTRMIEKMQGLPDLSCMMLKKICKMLLTCIQVYHKARITDTPWISFLEGTQGLVYDLSGQPSDRVLHGFSARLMFLPSYFMPEPRQPAPGGEEVLGMSRTT